MFLRQVLMCQRLALNYWSSCLLLPSAGMTAVHQHILPRHSDYFKHSMLTPRLRTTKAFVPFIRVLTLRDHPGKATRTWPGIAPPGFPTDVQQNQDSGQTDAPAWFHYFWATGNPDQSKSATEMIQGWLTHPGPSPSSRELTVGTQSRNLKVPSQRTVG